MIKLLFCNFFIGSTLAFENILFSSTLSKTAFIKRYHSVDRSSFINLESKFQFNEENKTSTPINHRFWSKSFYLDSNYDSFPLNDMGIFIQKWLNQNQIQIPKSEISILLIPSRKLIIPLHNNIVQTQHMQQIESLGLFRTENEQSKNTSIIICGLSPRAQHICVEPLNEERIVDIKRLEALNAALLHFTDTTGEELLRDNFAGTSPARIYRSFVSPRVKGVHILESVEKAANRTAVQIEMSLRQVRADHAQYLRNTDRSIQSIGNISSTNPMDGAQRMTHPITLVLDNIRSAFNVGSMFRTAETAGLAEVITCGITAHPPNPKLRKTAFSSIDVVPTRHFDDLQSAIMDLKSKNYTIMVMETTSRSQIYTDISYPKKLALVLGNEITGVDPRIMEAADLIIEIPTYGIKNSLNVASAAPIVVFEVLRQWNLKQ